MHLSFLLLVGFGPVGATGREQWSTCLYSAVFFPVLKSTGPVDPALPEVPGQLVGPLCVSWWPSRFGCGGSCQLLCLLILSRAWHVEGAQLAKS